MDPWGVANIVGLAGRRGGRGRGRPCVQLVVVRHRGETLRQGAGSIGKVRKCVFCWVLSKQVRVVNQTIVRFWHSPLLLTRLLLQILVNAVAAKPASAGATAAVAILAFFWSCS